MPTSPRSLATRDANAFAPGAWPTTFISLSANAHIGAGGIAVDQQTLEARAYAVARRYSSHRAIYIVSHRNGATGGLAA
jgi:uncharacterized RmlC-like cupin family protein